jgi:hypothetical protein
MTETDIGEKESFTDISSELFDFSKKVISKHSATVVSESGIESLDLHYNTDPENSEGILLSLINDNNLSISLYSREDLDGAIRDRNHQYNLTRDTKSLKIKIESEVLGYNISTCGNCERVREFIELNTDDVFKILQLIKRYSCFSDLNA